MRRRVVVSPYWPLSSAAGQQIWHWLVHDGIGFCTCILHITFAHMNQLIVTRDKHACNHTSDFADGSLRHTFKSLQIYIQDQREFRDKLNATSHLQTTCVQHHVFIPPFCRHYDSQMQQQTCKATLCQTYMKQHNLHNVFARSFSGTYISVPGQFFYKTSCGRRPHLAV